MMWDTGSSGGYVPHSMAFWGAREGLLWDTLAVPDCGEDADSALYVGDVGDQEAALGALFAKAAGHGVLGSVCQDGAERLAFIIRAVGVADKEQAHATSLEEYALDAKFTADAAQCNQADKLKCLLRNLAETVLQAVLEAFYISLTFHAVKLAVKKYALAAVGHECIREEQVKISLNGALINIT